MLCSHPCPVSLDQNKTNWSGDLSENVSKSTSRNCFFFIDTCWTHCWGLINMFFLSSLSRTKQNNIAQRPFQNVLKGNLFQKSYIYVLNETKQNWWITFLKISGQFLSKTVFKKVGHTSEKGVPPTSPSDWGQPQDNCCYFTLVESKTILKACIPLILLMFPTNVINQILI